MVMQRTLKHDLLMPADHIVRIAPRSHRRGPPSRPQRQNHLVTFGITPDSPETGYGYIRRGAALQGLDGCFAVARFVEKPDAATAASYVAAGDYGWNSGMFVFKASVFLAELERLEPELLAHCRVALANGEKDLDFFRLEGASFAKAKSISLDYAVMERTDKAAMVPVEMGWSDIGSWEALWNVAARDGCGNVTRATCCNTGAQFLSARRPAGGGGEGGRHCRGGDPGRRAGQPQKRLAGREEDRGSSWNGQAASCTPPIARSIALGFL